MLKLKTLYRHNLYFLKKFCNKIRNKNVPSIENIFAFGFLIYLRILVENSVNNSTPHLLKDIWSVEEQINGKRVLQPCLRLKFFCRFI